MPNWCYSTLEITGPKDEIKSIADTKIDFEKILPTPADLIPDTYDAFGMTEFQNQSNQAIYGCESWYEWHIQNWGTKWCAKITHMEQSDSTIRAEMQTAWSLPLELLKKLSVENSNTTIHVVDCEEESGSFVGDCKIFNGEIIEDSIHEPTKAELSERGLICGEVE